MQDMDIHYYGGLIWTNHALERLKERGLSQETAWETFRRPDHSFAGKQSGTTEYRKRFGASLVTLIAKPNEKKEWVILSCWVDPPLPGSIDLKKQQDYRNYKKASFWGKLWLVFKKQMGL